MLDYYYVTAIDYTENNFTDDCFMNCLTDPAFVNVVQLWKQSGKDDFITYLKEQDLQSIFVWFLENDLQDEAYGNYHGQSLMELTHHNASAFFSTVERLSTNYDLFTVCVEKQEFNALTNQDIIDAITNYLN